MSSHAPFVLPQGDQQLLDRAVEAGDDRRGSAAVRRELHRRDVLYRGGSWFPCCTCGWLGFGQISEAQAWLVPCGVEGLLAESLERKRRLIQAAGG